MQSVPRRLGTRARQPPLTPPASSAACRKQHRRQEGGGRKEEGTLGPRHGNFVVVNTEQQRLGTLARPCGLENSEIRLLAIGADDPPQCPPAPPPLFSNPGANDGEPLGRPCCLGQRTHGVLPLSSAAPCSPCPPPPFQGAQRPDVLLGECLAPAAAAAPCHAQRRECQESAAALAAVCVRASSFNEQQRACWCGRSNGRAGRTKA